MNGISTTCDNSSGINDRQELYPQVIYRINRAIRDVIQHLSSIEPKVSKYPKVFTVSAIHNNTKSFHWYIMNEHRWRFTQEQVKGIRHCFKNSNTNWTAFFEKLSSLKITSIDESIKEFTLLMSSEASEEKIRADIHFHLLNLYQSFPIPSNLYIDGVFYGKYTKIKKKVKYIEATRLYGDTQLEYTRYPYIEQTFYFQDGTLKKYNPEPQETPEEKRIDVNATNLFEDYITPIFTGELTDFSKMIDRSHEAKPNANTNDLIIPLYDAYIEGKFYGNVFANITLVFDKKSNRNIFIEAFVGNEKLQKEMYIQLN